MVLLHPFMPFITEEIWSMLFEREPLLARYTFTGVPGMFNDPSIEREVVLFQEIVTNLRNLRQTFNIPHGQVVNAVINGEQGNSLPEQLSAYEDQICQLAHVGELEITEGAPKPSGCAVAGLPSMEVYLLLEGIVDLEVERQRMVKDLAKISREYEKTRVRLEDRRFLERAPHDVIERERGRFGEISDHKVRIERILEDLG
jgi:valyl-tRNA synthetase